MTTPTDDGLDALSRVPGLAIDHRPVHDGGADVVSIRTATGTDR